MKKVWAYLEKTLQNNDIILVLILANAFIIFLQEFKVENPILNIFETLFTIAFILEVYFKSKTRTFKVYISTGWNKLDFILIAASLPSLFSVFVFDFDFLLILRVFRIFKFFRLLQYFPRINAVLPGIRRAIRASYLIFFGFFTLLVIFSMLSCSLFRGVAPELFGNPIDSMFSMFQVFSVEAWNTIPDLIATRSGHIAGLFTKLYFACLMFFGGIVGISIMNSIFVDAMVSDNNDDLKSEVKALKSEISELKTLIKESHVTQKTKQLENN